MNITIKLNKGKYFFTNYILLKRQEEKTLNLSLLNLSELSSLKLAILTKRVYLLQGELQDIENEIKKQNIPLEPPEGGNKNPPKGCQTFENFLFENPKW